MGFSTIRGLIVTAIRGVTPVRMATETFTCTDDATGMGERLDDFTTMSPLRRFDIRLASPPRDDGESGRSHRRVRAGLVLRCAYRTDTDAAYIEEAITEDTARLIDTLMLMPTVSGWGAAGGVSVAPPGVPELRVVRTSEDEYPVGVVLSIPFEVLYNEGSA